MLQLRRLGVDPAAAFNAAQAQQKGRRAAAGAQSRSRATKQQKQAEHQQQQVTLTQQMSRLTTAGAPAAAGPPAGAGGSTPNSPSGQFGTPVLSSFMELDGADLDGLPVMSLSADGLPDSPTLRAEEARVARRQQQQRRQQGGGGTVEGMPYMGDVPAAAAPGPPFGRTSTDMFLSASALEGTLSDPQTFQGHAASTRAPEMYSMPIPGGDLNGGGVFSYAEASSQRTMGEIMGVGLGSAAYDGSELPAADAVPAMMHSSDAFADFGADLETSTVQLDTVADGL